MGLFDFTKKKNVILEEKPELLEQVDVKDLSNPSVIIKHEVEGAEVWMVHWTARKGSFSSDIKPVAKGFLSEKDAETFAECLKEAQKILQYTENIGIKIEKAE